MATNQNPSKLQRSWVTPLVAGSFLLMGVTGILMFFHWDSGLNKTAHEWLGWAMVIAVTLHVTVNFQGFKNMFRTGLGKGILALFALILALSFLNLGGGEGNGGPLRLKTPLVSYRTPRSLSYPKSATLMSKFCSPAYSKRACNLLPHNLP